MLPNLELFSEVHVLRKNIVCLCVCGGEGGFMEKPVEGVLFNKNAFIYERLL